MNCKTDILIELENLSPFLAQLPKDDIFIVPPGYFETISNTVLLCINEASGTIIPAKNTDVPPGYFNNLSLSILNKIKEFEKDSSIELEIFSPMLRHINNANIFEVPQGFFKNLSFAIINKIKAQEGTEEAEENLSTLLLNLKQLNVFEVPKQYFKNLPDAILLKIKPQTINAEVHQNLSSLLSDVQQINVFEVPPGYFKNLSSSIANKVTGQQTISSADEIKMLSPLLQSLQHTSVFKVPQEYFSTITPQLLQSVKPVAAKIVPLRKINIFARLAAAAVITAVMALGVYKFTDKKLSNSTTVSNLAQANKSKLDSSIVKGSSMNDEQFDQSLNNLTADDIAGYLEKNNNEEDVAALTADADENTFPNKDDYLLDEKTLEIYLEQIKLQN